ncbi:sigma factor-like helix-turn-helix DNA-binding protein [Streptomyces sp. NPDC014746]|uniref:sigma factor-like helix-turn-helix DNA-binding protein n=1 Tax=Streptomyces sp. NPDC014746 TaxID=3364904 RepID=UPI003701AD27
MPELGGPGCFTVARRIAIGHFRAQSAQVKELGDETPGDHAGPEDPYEETVIAHALGDALAELPPHQQELLVELHLNDRSTTGATAVLGIPPGTVKSRNSYAVRALRPILERHGLAPAGRPLRPSAPVVPAGPFLRATDERGPRWSPS